MAVIGIDLGTTNSLAVTYRNGKVEMIPNSFGEYVTPSVVHYDGKELIVGKIAKEKLVTEPEYTTSLFKLNMGTDIKVKLGKKTFLPEELSSLVVKQLIDDAEKYLNEKVEEVVISVPAYFNAKQRKATKSIGDYLDVKIERLINEPSAAAIACHSDDEYETFVVFDFGGGTLDISVVDCFENVISITSIAGNNHLGGSDFDKAIAHHFCSEHNLIFEKLSKQDQGSILLAAERCKIALQHNSSSVMKYQSFETEYNEALLTSISKPILNEIKTVLGKAVKDSGFNASELDCVILVGGSSYMPTVTNYLNELLNIPVTSEEDIDLLVAKGLGKYIGIKQRNEEVKDIVVTDICPFSLCTAIINRANTNKSLSKVVISKNTVLPTSKSVALSTSRIGQTNINIEVFQGEEMYAEDNLLLGAMDIQIPYNKEKHEDFILTYSYDINSMLYIEIKIISTNEEYAFQIGKDNKLDKIANMKHLNTIKEISSQLNQHNEFDACIEKAQRIYHEANDYEKENIQHIIEMFSMEYEKNSNNIQKKKEVVEEMQKYLNMLDSGNSIDDLDIFSDNNNHSNGGFMS